jgi:hypothetical protein
MRNRKNALAKRLRQENIQFLTVLRRLEEAASAAPANGKQMGAALEAARAQLAEHFRLEEQSGRLDGVRDSEPRLERAVRHLLEEHHELMRSLDGLLDEARAGDNLEALQYRAREWIVAVREHEERENVLVVDAVNLDIPAED